MLGAHDDTERMREGSNQKQLQVESYLIHPNYNHESQKMDDDIALIKLKYPVNFDGKWNPVCLPNFSTHSNLFIYGWGRQNSGRSLTSSKVLHEVDIDEVDNSTCINKYWGYKYLPEKEICAGSKAGSCQGDSGGPLSTRQDGHVYQVGVVSFGTPGCGVEGQMKPDIYERVTAHMSWIEQNTRDGKWCQAPQTPEFTKRNPYTPGQNKGKQEPQKPKLALPEYPGQSRPINRPSPSSSNPSSNLGRGSKRGQSYSPRQGQNVGQGYSPGQSYNPAQGVGSGQGFGTGSGMRPIQLRPSQQIPQFPSSKFPSLPNFPSTNSPGQQPQNPMSPYFPFPPNFPNSNGPVRVITYPTGNGNGRMIIRQVTSTGSGSFPPNFMVTPGQPIRMQIPMNSNGK